MVLRKVVAFIGLLGVISALAWQQGLFDRAAAASPEPSPQSQAQPQIQAQSQVQTQTQAQVRTQPQARAQMAGPSRTRQSGHQKRN